MNEAPTPKPKRLRSPNYPAFPLSDAISKIQILWDKDGKPGAHRTVILKHLGFNSESGSALRNLSALKMFNLTSENNRHIVLTDTALDILLYSHDKNIYYRSLKESALNPAIYNELYNKYIDGLPSNDALKSELIREYNFNPNVVDKFINGFKSTLEYAGLLGGESDINIRVHDDIRVHEGYGKAKRMRTPVNQMEQSVGNQVEMTPHSYPIPFKGNKATIVFDKIPVTKTDLEKIKQWIDLFGDSLVGEDDSSEQ